MHALHRPSLLFAGSSGGASAAAAGPHDQADYRPGVCNIGPAEIAGRRRAGHVGVIVTVVFFAILVALNVPPIVRFLVALPAAGTAISYLQAYLHFCAGFGSRGVFNFGDVGTTNAVEDPAARTRDRSRSMQIFVAGLAIGAVVGVIAVVLPV